MGSNPAPRISWHSSKASLTHLTRERTECRQRSQGCEGKIWAQAATPQGPHPPRLHWCDRKETTRAGTTLQEWDDQGREGFNEEGRQPTGGSYTSFWKLQGSYVMTLFWARSLRKSGERWLPSLTTSHLEACWAFKLLTLFHNQPERIIKAVTPELCSKLQLKCLESHLLLTSSSWYYPKQNSTQASQPQSVLLLETVEH